MEKRLSMPDGMRVLAIGLVMAFHIWQQSWLWPIFDIGPVHINLSDIVATGYMWVDVMLLLSGMLLYMPISRGNALEIKRFYSRRLIRILPCYLLSLAIITFAFNLPQQAYGTNTRFLWKDLITHLTFTQTFFYDTYFATKLNFALWTLAVEMQFYLVFPFIAKAFKRRPAAVYLTMLFIAHVSRYMIIPKLDPVNMYMNSLPAMLDVYANGMLVAHILSLIEKNEPKWYIKLAYLIGMCAAAYGIHEAIMAHSAERYSEEPLRSISQMAPRFRMTFCCGLFLLFGERTFRFIKLLFSNPVTRFLCAISFNVYIYHQYLAVKLKEWHIPYSAFENPHMEGDSIWQVKYTALCFALALVFAAAVYFIFEKPLDKILTKLNKRTLLKAKPYYIISAKEKGDKGHELS